MYSMSNAIEILHVLLDKNFIIVQVTSYMTPSKVSVHLSREHQYHDVTLSPWTYDMIWSCFSFLPFILSGLPCQWH